MEKDLEKKCCDYAEKQGWKQRKVVSPGRRAAFDRIFIKGFVLFIEFKQPGEQLSPLQGVELLDLEDHGANALVIDNFKRFVTVINAYSRP